MTLKLENGLFSPCPLLFDAHTRRGGLTEFLDDIYSAKSRGIGLLYGENCIILTSTTFDWSTHVTDGQTDYTVFREKTPTQIFFHMSVNDVWI